MNKESGLPKTSKLNKTIHGIGLTNIQRCARKYNGDIDIVISNKEDIL
jgi:sensor histidine kinase YesM